MPVMKARARSTGLSSSGGATGAMSSPGGTTSGGGSGGDAYHLGGRGSKSSESGAIGLGSGAPSGSILTNGAQTGANQARSGGAAQAQAGQQQLTSAQARKRRSSINVYDQPSSLNSRLRQLETDMLRLDEDRTKLFDDTHSALTQYEIKLGEIHAILKSRQDNVDKYVEDMKMLLQAKEEFEKQTKMLNEKHDRIHEKFMHRETIISREIKLLKNKFELLEKNRQFRSLLGQKSSASTSDTNTGGAAAGGRDDLDLTSGLESSDFATAAGAARKRPSEIGSSITTNLSEDQFVKSNSDFFDSTESSRRSAGKKSVRISMTQFGKIGSILAPVMKISGLATGKSKGLGQRGRRNNKVSSIMVNNNNNSSNEDDQLPTSADHRRESASAKPDCPQTKGEPELPESMNSNQSYARAKGKKSDRKGSSSLFNRLFSFK